MSKTFIFEGYPNHLYRNLKAKNEREQLVLREKQGPGGQPYRLVFERLLLWRKQIITISFKNGTPLLHEKIARTAELWSQYANIKFDFGFNPANGTYRLWQPDTTADIRVGFEYEGYWSLVGTQSTDPEICSPQDITLNLEDFHNGLPYNWQGVVLHEFGHALGFHHEHQSPDRECDFDWDLLYRHLWETQGWDQSRVDFNLRQLDADGLVFSRHDKDSIMHYAFPDWMYKSGEKSPCYTSEHNTLSATDKRMATKAYPFGTRAINENINTAVTAIHNILQDETFADGHHIRSFKNLSEELLGRGTMSEPDLSSLRTRVVKAVLMAGGNWRKDPAEVDNKEKISDYLTSDNQLVTLFKLIRDILRSYESTSSLSDEELGEAETIQELVSLVETNI